MHILNLDALEEYKTNVSLPYCFNNTYLLIGGCSFGWEKPRKEVE